MHICSHETSNQLYLFEREIEAIIIIQKNYKKNIFGIINCGKKKHILKCLIYEDSLRMLIK